MGPWEWVRVFSILGTLSGIEPEISLGDAVAVDLHLGKVSLQGLKLLILWNWGVKKDAAGCKDLVVNAAGVVDIQVSHKLLVIVSGV